MWMRVLFSLCLTSLFGGCDSKSSLNPSTVPEVDLRGGQMGGQMGGPGGSMGGVAQEGIKCNRSFMYRPAQGVSEIKIGGSFENPPWSGNLLLNDEDQDGIWTVDLELAEGEYQYKMIVDGNWILDVDQLNRVDNGQGDQNHLIVHQCPFEPACLSDASCSSDAPYCRGFECQVENQPLACSQCAENQSCTEAGECVDPPEPQCDAQRPCDDPLVCREGQCVPECQSDEECEGEAICLDLQCRVPECETDAQCDRFTESCVQVQCVPKSCSEVVFVFDSLGESYDQVHLAGEFNNWAPTVADGGWPMERLDDGRYFARQTLENGTYQYKIVLTQNGGTTWITDPNAESQVTDAEGNTNSLLTQNCDDAPSSNQCGDPEVFQWEDAVMYFVMVDRFYDSDGMVDPVANATGGNAAWGPSGQYEGGDIKGVEEKLPYLSNLGVSAVWLSAPYENRNSSGRAIDPNSDPNQYSAYHGYWPAPANIDYSDPSNPSPVPEVESRIGTSDDLDSFVTQAHGSGVKVLFDYVMNHVDVESGLYQAHPDWFARRENGQFALCGPENLWEDVYWGTRCAFTDYLPPFDFDNADARLWSVNDALWWAERYQIDGYRLDAIKHVPFSWLEDLRSALNLRFPEPAGGRFYLVGETFAYDDPGLLRSFIDPDTMLDGQFDFPYKARLCEALFRPEGRMDSFVNWMNQNDSFYGPGALMTTWIGNHDIPRAIHFASGQIPNCRQGSFPGNGWTSDYSQPTDAVPYERLGLAFAVMMTNPGIPLIYYGDEVGLAGGGDPDNRRMMPWNDSDLNPHQIALRTLTEKLGQIRAQNLVLARGRRLTLSSDQDTWVYRMTGCGGDLVDLTIALNRADQPRNVSVPAGQYQDLLTEQAVNGGELSIPPRSLMILKASN